MHLVCTNQFHPHKKQHIRCTMSGSDRLQRVHQIPPWRIGALCLVVWSIVNSSGLVKCRVHLAPNMSHWVFTWLVHPIPFPSLWCTRCACITDWDVSNTWRLNGSDRWRCGSCFQSGEKVLVLKKKYRDSGVSVGSGAGDASRSSARHEVHHDFTTPMPKPPPRKMHKGAAQWEEGGSEQDEGGAASLERYLWNTAFRKKNRNYVIHHVSLLCFFAIDVSQSLCTWGAGVGRTRCWTWRRCTKPSPPPRRSARRTMSPTPDEPCTSQTCPSPSPRPTPVSCSDPQRRVLWGLIMKCWTKVEIQSFLTDIKWQEHIANSVNWRIALQAQFPWWGCLNQRAARTWVGASPPRLSRADSCVWPGRRTRRAAQTPPHPRLRSPRASRSTSQVSDERWTFYRAAVSLHNCFPRCILWEMFASSSQFVPQQTHLEKQTTEDLKTKSFHVRYLND